MIKVGSGDLDGSANPPQDYQKPSWEYRQSRQATKPLIFIFGSSKSGKSVLALSRVFLGERVVSLSWDKMTQENIGDKALFKDDPLIVNFDSVEHYHSDPLEHWLQSAHDTIDYNMEFIIPKVYEEFGEEIGTTVLDGYNIFQEVVQMRAKLKYNIDADKPVPEKHGAFWNERNRLMRLMTERCLGMAQNCMIVTTYLREKDMVTSNGITTSKESPAWSDWMEQRCQLVIQTQMERNHSRRCNVFYAYIYSAKGTLNEKWPTGALFDITGPENLKLFWEGKGKKLDAPLSSEPPKGVKVGGS